MKPDDINDKFLCSICFNQVNEIAKTKLAFYKAKTNMEEALADFTERTNPISCLANIVRF